MKIKSENHYTVIGWMRKLGLKGNDLAVYAIIYGFSQTEEQKFTGSLQYLADWCGSTKQGILKNLKNLIDAGLITKNEVIKNNVKFCEYSCTVLNSVEQGIKLSLTNNKDDNKDIISKDINNIKNPEKDNFLGSAKAEKKPNLYSNCISLIDDFINEHNCSSHIRKLLITHLDIAMENRSIRGQRQYKGILNKLYDLHEQGGDYKSMIQYSIEKGYPTFYSRNSSNSNYKPSSNNNALTHESGAKHVPRFTKEDEIKQEKFYEELKKQGKQIVF